MSGAGGGASCITDADCPSTSTECASYTCLFGACALAFAPQGYLTSMQTIGDCQKTICDGNGATTGVTDDADVPDDGNPCSADACAGGAKIHTQLASGASCGTGLVCDGAGSCVGCLADVDCPTNTACAGYHCQDGACLAEYTPSGTGNPGGQVAGDCKNLVCNGIGGPMAVADDTDVANDGNVCTADTCVGGFAQHQSTTGASCGAALFCNGASCEAGCVIGGVFRAAGALNPLGGCETCSPLISTSAWTAQPDGVACDDGNACTAGYCSSGVCQQGAAAPNGTPCPNAQGSPPWGPTPGVCSGGACYLGCFDGQNFWPPSNNALDTAVCKYCNPAISTWLYTGGCHNNGVSGACSAGVCYMASVGSCAGPCRYCGFAGCGGGVCYGAPLPFGTLCGDDGNACTSDFCDGHDGNCIHPPLPNGVSCGSGMTCSSGSCM